jgi:hypothetical protein
MKYLIIFMLVATSVHGLYSSNEQILEEVKRDHWEELPQWVQENYNIDSLRKLLTPTTLEVITPEGRGDERIDPSVIIQILWTIRHLECSQE